jgi:hypothetical protein
MQQHSANWDPLKEVTFDEGECGTWLKAYSFPLGGLLVAGVTITHSSVGDLECGSN